MRQFNGSLSPNHISQAHIGSTRRYTNGTPGAGSRLLTHKSVLLLTSAVTALCLDEELAAVARAKPSCMFEEDIRLALRHLAKDNNVLWVLLVCQY